MKQISAIILTSFMLAGLVNFIHPRRIPWIQDWNNYVESKAREAGIEVIPLSAALSLYRQGNHLFIDARSSAEYHAKHIHSALSLPFEDLDENVPALERVLASELPLLVYCRNRECDDALLLATELRAMGKSNLLYYVDGFELWEASGCPVEPQ